MKKIHSVEEYIETNSQYSEALTILRDIINTTELKETVKWSAPVYELNDKNVIGLGAFKNYFGIWFFNGVFLKDKYNLLINAQEKTKALRQMRFKTTTDINKDVVLSYIKEAIENQKLGKEIKPTRTSKKNIVIPELLKNKLQENKTLNIAFKALTPYKKREYCEYIATAKRDATKETRLQKITPMIINGVGLNDKYKNC